MSSKSIAVPLVSILKNQKALNFLNALAILSLLIAVFYSGLSTNDPSKLHARYWNYAIPGAVSEIGYGLDGYRAYIKVAAEIRGSYASYEGGRLDELLNRLFKLNNVSADGIFFFPGDEKGLQDFVYASFKTFGIKVSSLYYFYFLILSASLAVHMVCFRSAPSMMVVPAVFLASVYAVIPVLPMTQELGSLLNPRVFGLLSLPATLTLFCILLNRETNLCSLFFALIQSLIIAFVVHVRNAEIWQVIFLVVASIVVISLGVLKKKLPAVRAGIGVLLVVCLTFASVQVAVKSRLAPEYFGPKLTHKIFWHNVLIGFSISDYFAKRYGLDLSDTTILRYLATSPEGKDRDDVFYKGTSTGNMVGVNPEIPEGAAMAYVGMVRDFSGYENIARQVVFRMVVDSPLKTVRLLFVDKPKLFVRHMVNAFRPGRFSYQELFFEDQRSSLMSDAERKTRSVHVRMPWLMFILVVGLLAVNLTARRCRANVLFIGLIALMFGCSLLPLIMTYPLMHLMAVQVAVVIFFGLVLSAFAAVAVLRSFSRPDVAGRPAESSR